MPNQVAELMSGNARNEVILLRSLDLFSEGRIQTISLPDQTVLTGDAGLLKPEGDDAGRMLDPDVLSKIDSESDRYSRNTNNTGKTFAITIKH